MTALASRVKRARAVVDAGMVEVLRRKGNRQRAWRMPSASVMGSWYEVFTKLTCDNGVVKAHFFCNRCYVAPDGNGMSKCEGNRNTVCYHCLAAMVKLAKGRRMTVQFLSSRKKALALFRMGTVVEMHGEGQSQPRVWAVMKKRGRRKGK